MPLEKGWDLITTMCDEYKSLDCPVCNQKMQVKRGYVGPTCSIEAMEGKGHKHDQYTCKNYKENWHIQVKKLRVAMRKTPSATIAALYKAEIDEILVTKKATKEISDLFD